MAEKQISRILVEAREKWDLKIAVALHRLGIVPVLESAVAVITACAHRKEAYESNRWIIDSIKTSVPIWKKELYADGSSVWVNCAAHD